MKIGVNMRLIDDSPDVAELARVAESLGFESIWLPEHPIMPVRTDARYGGTPDGTIPPDMAHMGDPFVGLARASAVTTNLKLGTGVCLVPERNPLLLAKEIATLDSLSGGRFIFGIGAGWLREETEIMGGDFAHRWGQTGESILAMKELWTRDEGEFHGRFYDFPLVRSFPKPAQKPHPPILLGGFAANVFKRAAAWGDGWMPTRVTPEQIKMGRAAIEELAEAGGRDPARFDVTMFGVDPDADQIRRFEEAGADRAIVLLPTPVGENAARDLERLAGEVL